MVSGTVTNYATVATTYPGLPIICDRRKLQGQSADIVSTQFVNTGVGSGAFYRISYYLQTQVVNVGAGTVTLNITYSDLLTARTVSSSSVNLTAGNFASGVVILQPDSSTVSFNTSHTGSYSGATYRLDLCCEQLYPPTA